jgi:hypothetical protein
MTRGHQDLDHRTFELPESPEVGGTPVGRHPARRQACSEDIALEARPRSGEEVDAGMDCVQGAGAQGVLELPLGETGVEPLAARQDPVLPGGQTEDGGDDVGGRAEPERITHSQ